MPSLPEIGWVVFRDVNRTVGGGFAGMELMRRSFVARGWLDAAGHGVLSAISRLTPGTNVLAYCVGAGWQLRGWRGSLVALGAASIPGCLIVFVLTATLARLDRYPAVRFTLAMGMIVAAMLVILSAWSLAKPFIGSPQRRRAAAIVVLAVTLIALDWTPVRVLLTCALAGALLPPDWLVDDEPPASTGPTPS